MNHEKTCPICNAKAVRIVYGYPGEELIEQAKSGEVAIGGCVIEEDAPDWRCGSCGHEWAN